MERWLKPLVLFCTKHIAASIISISVAAALPFVIGFWRNQNRGGLGSLPTASVSRTAQSPQSPIAAPGGAPTSTEPKAQQHASVQPPLTPATGSLDPAALPSTAEKPSYSVTLFLPTRYRKVEVIVDGKPALITDAQLSQIKLYVPRKATPTHFSLHSDLLSRPREFDLLVDRDNFEYSPMQ